MRPEERIEKKFVRKARKLGCKCYKFQIFGLKGPYDQIVFVPGCGVVFIEFKTPGESRSYHQVQFGNMLDECDLPNYVFDNWEMPLKLIDDMIELYHEGLHI